MASGDGFDVDGGIWRMYLKGISKEMDPVWISSILSIRLLGSEENSNIRHESELGFHPERLNVHFQYSIWSWWFHPNWILVVTLDDPPQASGAPTSYKQCWKNQPISPRRVQITNLNILRVLMEENPELRLLNMIFFTSKKIEQKTNWRMFLALSIYMNMSPQMWLKPIQVEKAMNAVSGIFSVYIYTNCECILIWTYRNSTSSKCTYPNYLVGGFNPFKTY